MHKDWRERDKTDKRQNVKSNLELHWYNQQVFSEWVWIISTRQGEGEGQVREGKLCWDILRPLLFCRRAFKPFSLHLFPWKNMFQFSKKSEGFSKGLFYQGSALYLYVECNILGLFPKWKMMPWNDCLRHRVLMGHFGSLGDDNVVVNFSLPLLIMVSLTKYDLDLNPNGHWLNICVFDLLM